MALQWMILACVVAVEAAVAALVTLPVPRAVRGQIVALTSLFLQPLSSVIPFAAFQLLGACVAASPRPRPSACDPVSGSDWFVPFFLCGCRYLLEEGAQADVHLGDLHRRRAHSLREICE
jgi:hypothetical protein